MSSAYSGVEVPLGIAADAFYEKASGIASLVQIVDGVAQRPSPPSSRDPNALAPIWILGNGHDSAGRAQVVLACPECLRTFPHLLGEGITQIHQTGCVYCCTAIYYAVVQDTAPATLPAPLPPARLMPGMLQTRRA
jgi:hypothetical protein